MGAVSLLVKCMCQDGCVPDATTNSNIVKGSAKGDLDRGLKVFQRIVRRCARRAMRCSTWLIRGEHAVQQLKKFADKKLESTTKE
eukprot:1956354-Amphidinium_carterae.1